METSPSSSTWKSRCAVRPPPCSCVVCTLAPVLDTKADSRRCWVDVRMVSNDLPSSVSSTVFSKEERLDIIELDSPPVRLCYLQKDMRILVLEMRKTTAEHRRVVRRGLRQGHFDIAWTRCWGRMHRRASSLRRVYHNTWSVQSPSQCRASLTVQVMMSPNLT